MDFAGFQNAYTKYFATPTQPNKPARTTVQVSALASPGYLIEIERPPQNRRGRDRPV
ncbi:MAG: hypothetical protein QOJ54_2702 [Aliidongia sp.]|jgi:enamine deaminase RidA (YjgF/YER057c/UK114 family)|nr:hypothetical protein [Aliidongia sp.]